jgi:hypothetical protein
MPLKEYGLKSSFFLFLVLLYMGCGGEKSVITSSDIEEEPKEQKRVSFPPSVPEIGKKLH